MNLNEFEIIHSFFEKQTNLHSNVTLGIGDDAALVSVPANHQLAITTDTLIAGVHFPEDTSAFDIGFKSLAVNLSDLAAMGATPAYFTLALTLPHANENWLKEFSSGLFNLAKKYHMPLIGGDLTRGSLSITIAAYGFIPAGLALRRDGAQPDDLIFVSNTLGDAGLALLNHDEKLLEKLNRPEPQIILGEKLRGIASAAIDISDGLAADLSHILEKSQVGAKIIVDEIPLSNTLLQSVSFNEAIELALTAGDDYELCFTVPKNKMLQLQNALSTFSYTCIGTITESLGLDLKFKQGTDYALKKKGYRHF